MKRLLEIQCALLGAELDRAEAQRRLGPVTRTWSNGLRMQCDTAGTPLAGAVLELLDSGELGGVQLDFRQPIVEQWSTILGAVGGDAEEHHHTLDHPGGPLSITLKSTGSRCQGVVILELDRKLSKFTGGGLGERTPVLAAITAAIVRRLDPWT